jgi:hypothetical protein
VFQCFDAWFVGAGDKLSVRRCLELVLSTSSTSRTLQCSRPSTIGQVLRGVLWPFCVAGCYMRAMYKYAGFSFDLGPGGTSSSCSHAVVGHVSIFQPATGTYSARAALHPGISVATQDGAKQRAYRPVSSILLFMPLSLGLLSGAHRAPNHVVAKTYTRRRCYGLAWICAW